eukprot:5638887-Pyramimonas_sp.AAC.1
MQQAQIPLSPKHHMWIEMNLRLEQCGNPTGYSCFLDESLNSTLAALAGAAHRATWEKSIFDRVRLLPFVERASYFALV